MNLLNLIVLMNQKLLQFCLLYLFSNKNEEISNELQLFLYIKNTLIIEYCVMKQLMNEIYYLSFWEYLKVKR